MTHTGWVGERSIIVQVLGSTRCAIDGEPVRLTAREGSVLAAIAAGGGRTVTYEELFSLVWGSDAPASARAVVHNAVSSVRRKTGCDDIVCNDVAGYRLGTEVGTDLGWVLTEGARLLARSPSAVTGSEITQVLDAVRGPAFEDLAEGVPLEARREQVRDLVVGLAALRAAAVIATGGLDEGLGLLRLALVDEPADPRLCGLTMIALHRGGRSREALEVLAAYKGRLLREAGLEPPSWLISLELRLLSDDPMLLEPEAIDLPLRPLERQLRRRLVGRDDTVAAVRSLLGTGRGALLYGPPGAGKTALLQEVVEGLAVTAVASVRGVETAASPFEPVVALLDQLSGLVPDASTVLRQVDLPALARLMPRLASLNPDATVAALDVDRARTDAALVEALVALGERAPVGVVVDDLHCIPPLRSGCSQSWSRAAWWCSSRPRARSSCRRSTRERDAHRSRWIHWMAARSRCCWQMRSVRSSRRAWTPWPCS